jgi:hypothetical protein
MSDKREPFNPLLKSYPDSEKVNACSIGAETLFTRLIAQSDDYGHYYGDAGMVIGKLYTRRMCAGQVREADVEGWISELASQKLVDLYECAGQTYLEVVNCRKALRHDVKLDVRFPYKKRSTRNASVTDSGRTRDKSATLTQPNPTQPNPLHATEASRDGVEPSGFAEFWEEYPRGARKKDKAKCLRRWKRGKLEEIAEKVLDGLRRWKVSEQWVKEKGRFISAPLVFLNQNAWEAEPEPAEIDDGERRGPTPEELLCAFGQNQEADNAG